MFDAAARLQIRCPASIINGGTHRMRPRYNRGNSMGIIAWLIVGAIAGWLAGLIVRGFGFGLLGNIVVGIVGAVVAGWLLPRLGILIGGGMIAEIINAMIGAIILLLIIGLIRR
jgi:uncharacterized membrane protein YeaQ/YmgE (transglycosylase-associated protein family)